jgi:hypothetical protein
MAREIAINKIAVNAAMLVLGFGAGYWYATKTAYEIVREALTR